MTQSDEETEDGRLSFFTNPLNWPLFYHTAKNMKARQLVGIAERKARHAVIPRLPMDFDERYEQNIPNELVVTPTPIAANSDLLRDSLSPSERERYRNLVGEALEGELTFLNRTIDFGDEIDWDHELLEEYPLLWRLKLQSFEFLEWAVLGFEDPSEAGDIHDRFQRWLLSWAESNPIGDTKYLRRSWIPHSVSLRVLNWSRYAAWCEQGDISVDNELYRHIYKNSIFLENHIENEVGGNHLIENGIALLMAGVLFKEINKRWIEVGSKILNNACRTQFLSDGGHFERSPMYHLMVLRRLVTAYHLIRRCRSRPDFRQNSVKKAVKFLKIISEPDGCIPLLNDSVRREQISAMACRRYANACGLSPKWDTSDELEGSSYLKLKSGISTMLVDVGKAGPSHLPAHSHNDYLSVLLWIDGEALLTDTGVYDYSPTPRRQYSRSISAHNTVQYEDVEPTPIGGSYLMGKRATVDLVKKERDYLLASCSRETLIGPSYQHSREITVSNNNWAINDSVKSKERGTYTVRYHLAPDVEVEESENTFNIINNGRIVLATFRFEGASGIDCSESAYFERFGTQQMRPVISVKADAGGSITTYISPQI